MNKGDRAALDSGKFAVQMAAQFNAKLTPRLKAETKSEAITEELRKTVLAELASGVGLKPDEIDQAIRAYGGKTSDPNEAGVIALYERNYAKATAELTRSYEMREQALDKAREDMVAVALSFLGPEHPNVAIVLENYAVLLRKMKREEEAAKLEARAREIRAKAR
jgi:hypothetical protein